MHIVLIKGLDEGVHPKTDGAHGKRPWALIHALIPMNSPNFK